MPANATRLRIFAYVNHKLACRLQTKYFKQEVQKRKFLRKPVRVLKVLTKDKTFTSYNSDNICIPL